MGAGAEAFKIASSTPNPGNSGSPVSRDALRKANDISHSARKDRAFERGRIVGFESGKTFQQSLLDSQTDRIQLLTQQLSEKQASEALAQQKLGATQLLLQTTTKDLVVAQLRITELEGETARLRSQLTAAQGTIKPSPSSSVWLPNKIPRIQK